MDRAPESELTGMSDEAQPSGQQAEQGWSSEEELDEALCEQPAAPPPPPAPAAEPQPGPAAQQLGTPLEQKIERTRQLVTMLVRMRMNGVKSQGELAERLGWSTRDLSNFMTGKATHKGKTLDRTVLGTRAANLLSDLERCGFMTTTHCPRAATTQLQQPPPSAAPTATTAPSLPPPPKPPPPKPPPPKLPGTAILSVNLTEVDGAHVGGTVHILDLGEREAVEGDPRWQMPCPRSDGGQTLSLRVGFRGRRTVSRGALGGRTFEFWVERLCAPLEPGLDGAPLWVGRELKTVGRLVAQGPRVVGRLAGQPSTPAALWTGLARACGSQTRVSNPFAWCGLLHPSVQGLLDAAAAAPLQCSLSDLGEEAAAIGSQSGGLRGLTADGSQLRLIGQLAGDAFVLAMKAISPTEPELVFEQLLKRKEFQLSWLPEELRKGLSKVRAASHRAVSPRTRLAAPRRAVSPCTPSVHRPHRCVPPLCATVVCHRCVPPPGSPCPSVTTAVLRTQEAVRHRLLAHPFVEGLAKVYQQLPDWRAKRQHLSLFAPYFPYEVRPTATSAHPCDRSRRAAHALRAADGDGRQAWGSEEGRRHRGRCAGRCASCGKARPQRCSRCASRRSGRRAGRRACCGAGQAQEGTQMTAWCLVVNVSLSLDVCQGVWVSRFEARWLWVSCGFDTQNWVV